MYETALSPLNPAPSRPRRAAGLSRRQRGLLVALHVGSGGAWLGTALCMTVVSLAAGPAGDPAALHAVNQVLERLDDPVMISSSLAATATGLLLSWRTSWGFFKFHWVIAKQILTFVVMLAAAIWLHGWIKQLATISAHARAGAPLEPAYALAHRDHVLGSLVAVAAIGAIVLISVLKPWGRRRPARTESLTSRRPLR